MLRSKDPPRRQLFSEAGAHVNRNWAPSNRRSVEAVKKIAVLFADMHRVSMRARFFPTASALPARHGKPLKIFRREVEFAWRLSTQVTLEVSQLFSPTLYLFYSFEFFFSQRPRSDKNLKIGGPTAVPVPLAEGERPGPGLRVRGCLAYVGCSRHKTAVRALESGPDFCAGSLLQVGAHRCRARCRGQPC